MMVKNSLICCVILAIVSGCAIKPATKNATLQNSEIAIQLTPHPESKFHQVTASFTVNTSKETAFKVISDLAKTPLWLKEVSSIRTLKIYDFNNFLLKTILDSPWPFKPRETITCVATSFEDLTIDIAIESCNKRHPESHNAVRISQLNSHWQITQINDTSVNVQYSVWLDPAGNVPAYFFNRQLPTQTKRSMRLLKQLIEDTSDLK